MDRFSEAYDKAKAVLRVGKFAGEVEKLRSNLVQLLADDGPSSTQTMTLDSLRSLMEQGDKSVNAKKSTTVGAHAEAILEAAGAASGRGERAATLKMLYHFYHGRTAGSSVIWVYSPPLAFTKWVFDELATDGENALRTALLKDGAEVYSEGDRKVMCDAVQTARKVAMDAAAKVASPDSATTALIKQYFTDASTSEDDLKAITRTLNGGYQKIASGLNSNLLIISDEPGDRNSGGWKDWAFIYPSESMKVIYLQGAWLAKAGEVTPSNSSPLYRCVRTLIHEMSHKEIATDDVVYGPKGLKPAGSSTLKAEYALHNADSWAYFAVDVVGQLTGPDRDNATKVCTRIIKPPEKVLKV
jgi:hypothetical protein